MTEEKTSFSTFALARALNTPRSNLQLYIDKGYLVPSMGTARGRGTRSRFSLEDAYRIRLFQKLHEAGLSQREAAKLANDFDFGEVVNSFDVYLVIPHGHGGSVGVLCDESQLMKHIRESRTAIFIGIKVGMIVAQVNEKLKS
jgi:DNA-binding transcriptional MerR regulator